MLTLIFKCMKQVNLKLVKSILPLLFGLFFSMGVFAQQITVVGTVKDAKGEPVIGANVSVKGATTGTMTDIDGAFQLKAPQNSILTVSFIGYRKAEVKAAKNLNVILQDDAIVLESAVVIGYGSVKKKDLTGSVIAIKAEQMNKGAITSPQELLQGKVPGLFVQPGAGAPGAGATIRIRGGASLNASNDPLVVIDGVPVSNDAAPGTPNALATINPNDIETFTVLKDASSTAIYGSRASNGVIIITTKKGSQKGFKVDYVSTYSISDPYNKVKTMSPDQFRDVINANYPAGTGIGDNAQKLLNQYPGQSTKWQDEVLRKGFATDQNLSISGKAGILPYRVSFGYNNINGTLKTSNYERYTGSVNLSPKFFDNHLSVDINFKGTINNNKFADAGAVQAAAFYDPTKPIYDEKGYHGFWNHMVNGSPNKLASVNPLGLLYDVDNHGKAQRSLGNIQLDYKLHFLPDLHANLNLGYDVTTSTGYNGARPGSFQTAKDTDFPNVGQHTEWDQLRRNQLLDFYLNYTKELTKIKSNINVMAGYSWQRFYSSNYDLSASNVTEKGVKEGWTYNDETSQYQRNGQRIVPTENRLLSFFGRLNYVFMDRYSLTATLRNDGSSRFSPENRWGLFPSAAFAWTISSEPFMRNIRALSNLKLRLGYGITGQQDLGKDYEYIARYIFSTNPNSTYLGTNLLKPAGYNKNLKWEQTATTNIGLDFGFLNNRFSGSVEYYQKDTKDLLNEVDATAGTGFSNVMSANVGSMKNKGVEMSLNAVVIKTKDLTWDLGYNITWNTSKISQLTATYNPAYPGVNTGNPGFGTSNYVQKQMEGYTPNTFFLYQQVYDKNGTPIQNALVDRNKDGVITEADRYLAKSPMPKVFMGLSSTLQWKKWDLGFNLRANFDNYTFNAFAAANSTMRTFSNQGSLSNIYSGVYDTKFALNNTTEQQLSDLFLENASFLKMDNLTLGYSFKKIFSQKIGGRINFAVQNVFTITKYKGLDPEGSGIDNNVWPRPRTYTMGVSLNF